MPWSNEARRAHWAEVIKARRDANKCTRCAAGLPKNGLYRMCAGCRAAAAKRNAARYARRDVEATRAKNAARHLQRKLEGRCNKCGCGLVDEVSSCEPCRVARNESQVKRRKRLEAKKLCNQCGREKARKGKKSCEKCSIVWRADYRRKIHGHQAKC
jgi:hypothetical protein